MRDVLTLILAGGKGTRLEPLTRDRAKPAVPFGGIYRIIDFALSNCINSGLRRILVMTQYKAASLDRHINLGWRFLCRDLNEFVDVLPPQQRLGEHWYRGTADAVYQNIYTIEQHDSEHILILAGDHIYKMDYAELVADHVESDADATIACLPETLEAGRQFGVMGIDSDHWVRRFEEKPSDPFPIPGDPTRCLASMGVYVFRTSFLLDQLCQAATQADSNHDFGKDIIPTIIEDHRVRAFPFRDKNNKDAAYWRDVGTLDAYYEANLDLVSVDPLLNLYDESWPIRGYHPPLPPPKFVFAQTAAEEPRVGHAMDSLVCPGCIISGGEVSRSILSPRVRINSWATVEGSILFEGVDVGRHARIHRAIIDKGVEVPENMVIGEDPERDRARGLTVTESGVTVIAKSNVLRAGS
ncbi:Glucose-1-phosphate adenylyltransferase [Maioricimonas rarisocia]|uniref:Glucose-1-phosphate adenylyltransferase n=1 Tax=Maioricimonas rarisocia TaxID=2528026 RepID=A0A517Z8M6_9PLAN|nr:glucose-1-phosphate adenylyltransferase [Maioricimonas rarisocia]QDU38838.1 Glucose-1-phosphate adenylyltransferase [Maioricimonas rarisocia]